MFSVIFEVHPKSTQWDAYLGYARLLRPELEQVDGFIDNIRYRSLRREGWLLSLSNWRDEKALIRWRTHAAHHGIQEKGRFEVFQDYQIRVGQLTRDTRLPEGHVLREQRLDETETGKATTLTMINAGRPSDAAKNAEPGEVAAWLGLAPEAPGLVTWDVFEAVLTEGEMILLLSWHDGRAAEAYEATANLPMDARLRQVRIVRDYAMFDRREAPQYYPDVTASESEHSSGTHE